MYLSLSLSLSLYLSLSLSFFWSGHVSSSLWSNVSKVTSLLDCSLKVFSKCISLCHYLCLCLCPCLCLCLCLFFLDQVMSPCHSDQMSQRSQVSRVALCMSKVKVASVSESVSEWVTRSPIELFWTAKNSWGGNASSYLSLQKNAISLLILRWI